MQLSRELIHTWAYYFSLCLFVVSLPTSRFFLTVSLIVLIVNWLGEANFREKFKILKSNKAAIALVLIYIINVIGLAWSSNISYAFRNDLLHKLPSLILPIVIVTSPAIDNKKIRLLLLLFISSVLAVTIIGLFIRLANDPVDFREASPFVPNIYFSMMLLLSAFQLPLLAKQISSKKILIVGSVIVSLWFVFYIFFLRSISGVVSLLGILFFTIIIVLYYHKNNLLRISLSGVFVFLLGSLIWLFSFMYTKTHYEVETDFSSLKQFSKQGNSYLHDTNNILRENGHLVYIDIAGNELAEAWNQRSEVDFYGNDLANHPLQHTLYRYMASKGLTKDKEGVDMLTQEDIEAIEKGTTNYLYNSWPGFFIRAHQMMMGLYIYQKSSFKSSSWSTLTERIDLWRASLVAFKKHPLLGWGTGSILNAVDYGLEKNESSLIGKNMKPHNQYIYLLLTLGIIGLVIFLSLYAYFVFKTKGYMVFIYIVFIIIFFSNFLANNSFESQVGQNLFVFFSLFYGLLYPRLNSKSEFIY